MTLAQKIIDQRKKHGWSQEDLADKCSVSRQAVSKWENGESIPDLDKIVCMSDLFGVCTDYLLKEKNDINPGNTDNSSSSASQCNEEKKRFVTKEEAEDYISLVESVSNKLALGVMLCILSPINMILLPSLSTEGILTVSRPIAFAIGFVILFTMVAFGVSILISNGIKLGKYDFLEHEVFTLQEEEKQIIVQKKADHMPVLYRNLITGVVLCILSALPVILASVLLKKEMYICGAVGILLVMVACGVYFFISAGAVDSSYKKLLQEEDFTVEEKSSNKSLAPLSGFYWMIIVAVYLSKSLKTGDWGRTWIIWPIAGIVFGAIQGILKAMLKYKNKSSVNK